MEHPSMNPTNPTPEPVDTEALKRLLEAATPGPWSVRKEYFDRDKPSKYAAYEVFPHTNGRKKPEGGGSWTGLCKFENYDGHNKANADLIAALRNEAPALLDELESRRSQEAVLREDNEAHVQRAYAAERERDSLRRENAELRSEIEQLKDR